MKQTSLNWKFGKLYIVLCSLLALVILLPASLVSAGAAAQTGGPDRPPLADRYGDLSALPLAPLPAEARLEVVQQPSDLPAQPAGEFNCYLMDSNPDYELFRRTVFQSFVNNSNWDVGRLSDCINSDAENLTNHPAADVYPRLKPGADRFVFASNRTGNFEIFTAAIDGSSVRQLTNHPALDTQPSWSPDGKQVVFVSERSGDAELYLINNYGGELLQLTNFSGIDMTPDWSPDGSKIAWVQASNGYGRIVTFDLKTSFLQVITAWLPYLSTPMWSPDGKRLAFEYDGDNDGWIEVGIVNADSTNLYMPVKQGNDAYDQVMGSWSVTNQYLFFSAIHYIEYDDEWYVFNADIERLELNGSSWLTGFTPVDWHYWKYNYYPHSQTMDNSAPESTIAPLPEFSPASGFYVQWQVHDPWPGEIIMARLEKKIGSATDWLNLDRVYYSSPYTVTDVARTIRVNGQPGETLSFRVQGNDLAGHVEPWKPSGNGVSTRLYRWVFDGLFLDVRGNPLSEVDVQCDPNCLNESKSDVSGHAWSYLSNEGQIHMSAGARGFSEQPFVPVNADQNQTYFQVLSAGQNAIINPGFETQILDDWQTSGCVQVTSILVHSGTRAAILGISWPQPDDPMDGEAILSQSFQVPEVNQPTLSLLYRQLGQVGPNGSMSGMLFAEGSSIGVPIFTTTQSVGWQHAWLDLTPWIGQTVRLEFKLTQVAGEPYTYLLVDDVTVGAWTTPLLEQIGPQPVFLAAGQSTVNLTLTGENFMPGAQVLVDGQALASGVTWLDEGHIQVLLPTTGYAVYSLRVENPGGARSSIQALTVGQRLFIPVISN